MIQADLSRSIVLVYRIWKLYFDTAIVRASQMWKEHSFSLMYKKFDAVADFESLHESFLERLM